MREYKHSIKQVGKKGVCTPRGTPPLCTNRAKYNTRYRYNTGTDPKNPLTPRSTCRFCINNAFVQGAMMILFF